MWKRGARKDFHSFDPWYEMIDHAMVYSKEDVRFTFKNGVDI
jgi:hypothetical protein